MNNKLKLIHKFQNFISSGKLIVRAELDESLTTFRVSSVNNNFVRIGINKNLNEYYNDQHQMF